MFLKPGTVDPATQLYRGQPTVQVILLLIAFVCVPWLLTAKPYLQYKEMKKIQGQGYIGLGGEDVVGHDSDEVLEGEEEGNGRAIAEAMDEEHVSLAFSGMRFSFHLSGSEASRLEASAFETIWCLIVRTVY